MHLSIRLVTVLIDNAILGRKISKIRKLPHVQPNLSTIKSHPANDTIRIRTNYKHCSYVGFYNFWTPSLVLRDLSIIDDILITNFNSFHDGTLSLPDPVASINPFFTTGETWKSVRNEFVPHVSSAKLKQMLPLIEIVCKNMVQFIRESGGNSMNTLNVAYRFTGDNVVSCAYGLEGKSFTEEDSIMFRIQKDMTIQNNTLSLINHTVGFFLPNISKICKISYFGKFSPQSFKDTITAAIRYRKESKIVVNDFLNFLMEMQDKRKDLRHFGHACNFYLDAFETTALAFCYALHELSKNPDVQEEAENEIKWVLKNHSSLYTSDAQKELIYMEYILFETLRKYPIIKFLSRKCTKDFLLPPAKQTVSEKVHVKKGTEIYIPIEAIHMNPDYFPEPELFDPNRFNPENSKTRPKNAFMGFGNGPRICSGRPFGITQIKMGLTAVLSNFNLFLSDETVCPVEKGFNHNTTIPKNTIYIKFVPKTLT